MALSRRTRLVALTSPSASAPAPPVSAVADNRLALVLASPIERADRLTSPDLFSSVAPSRKISETVSVSMSEMPTLIPNPEKLSTRTRSAEKTFVKASTSSTPGASLLPPTINCDPDPTDTLASNGLVTVPMSVSLDSAVTLPAAAEPAARFALSRSAKSSFSRELSALMLMLFALIVVEVPTKTLALVSI